MKVISENKKIKFAVILLAIVVLGLAAVFTISYYNHQEDMVVQNSTPEPTQQTVTVESVTPNTPEANPDVTPSPAEIAPDKPTMNENPPSIEPSTSSIQEDQPQTGIKPTEPPKPTSEGDVTEKTQQPTYTPEDITTSSSEPKMGDKNDKGEIYVEGFGWVKDTGSESDVTVIDSDGDINTQIGTMN